MSRETHVHEVSITALLAHWASEYEMRNKDHKIVQRKSYIDPVKGVAVFILDVEKPDPASGNQSLEAKQQ